MPVTALTSRSREMLRANPRLASGKARNIVEFARTGHFREFMSSFATGVAIVTAFDRGGRPHGLTCTSLASITLVPPTILVSLDTASGTLAAIRDGGRFAVNLLHSGAKPTAELFASAAGDRFDRVSWVCG